MPRRKQDWGVALALFLMLGSVALAALVHALPSNGPSWVATAATPSAIVLFLAGVVIAIRVIVLSLRKP